MVYGLIYKEGNNHITKDLYDFLIVCIRSGVKIGSKRTLVLFFPILAQGSYSRGAQIGHLRLTLDSPLLTLLTLNSPKTADKAALLTFPNGNGFSSC
jgi:hypothetical protein